MWNGPPNRLVNGTLRTTVGLAFSENVSATRVRAVRLVRTGRAAYHFREEPNIWTVHTQKYVPVLLRAIVQNKRVL